MVEEQKFRADLFYRLNVFPAHVPALRERQDDIPLLVRHFVQQFARRMNKAVDTVPTETMNALVRYHWPGNIRELQNLVERAVILSTGPILKVPLNDLQAPPAPAAARRIPTLQEAERRHILEALDASNWVISGPNGAAASLGLKRSTLQARMDKLGIRRARTAGVVPAIKRDAAFWASLRLIHHRRGSRKMSASYFVWKEVEGCRCDCTRSGIPRHCPLPRRRSEDSACEQLSVAVFMQAPLVQYLSDGPCFALYEKEWPKGARCSRQEYKLRARP
jgi:Bacterial regulatory protein, Fis family